MTKRRYDAYRRARDELALLRPATLADAEHELLRDSAEGLLLARSGDEDEVEELRSKVAVALSLIVGLGRCSDEAADDLWFRLIACGPYEYASGARTRRLPALSG